MKINSPFAIDKYRLENPILRIRNNFVVPISREKMRGTFSPVVRREFHLTSTIHGN